MQVDASVSKVYRIWANRINYNEWFDLIGQVCTPGPLLSHHLASLSPMGSPSYRNTASDRCRRMHCLVLEDVRTNLSVAAVNNVQQESGACMLVVIRESGR